MVDAKIRGSLLAMADSLVAPNNRKHCREAVDIDVTKLSPNDFIPVETFNKYMRALKRRTGKWGPKLIGSRIIPTIYKMGLAGYLDESETIEEAMIAERKIFTDHNIGPDAGYYKLVYIDDNIAKVETTSHLLPEFHMGVGEGTIRFFDKMARGEITKTMDEYGVYEFTFRW
jgi:hypothetical protein